MAASGHFDARGGFSTIMAIPSKLPAVGLTIFSEMTGLALQHHAINLSQGFPDFDTHSGLKDLVAKYIRAGCNQYAPMPGVAALREAVAAKVRWMYDAVYDPEAEVTVTTGGTQAIYAAVTAVVHPGDEVILVEPAYDCYAPIVRLNGGVPVITTLDFPSYRIDWDAFARLINAKSRLVILNFPHNPSGAVLNAQDLETLAAIAALTRSSRTLASKLLKAPTSADVLKILKIEEDKGRG